MTLRRFYGFRELEIAISLVYSLLLHCDGALRFPEMVLDPGVYDRTRTGWVNWKDSGVTAEMHYNNSPSWMNEISFIAVILKGQEAKLLRNRGKSG